MGRRETLVAAVHQRVDAQGEDRQAHDGGMRLLILIAVVLAACESAPVPVVPSPSAGPAATPAPTFLGARVPIGAEWTVDAPANTYEASATWTKLVALRPTGTARGGFELLAADAPRHDWKVAYTSGPGAQSFGTLSGGEAYWYFVEASFAPGTQVFDVMSVDLGAGTARRLDRSTLPQEVNARLPNRARPTVVGDHRFVAWTRVRMVDGALLWELFETALHVPRPVRLVRSSKEPLVPLSYDGGLAYVVATPAGDELWTYDEATGFQARWLTGKRIGAAAWSAAGLIVAVSDDAAPGAIWTIATVNDRGDLRPIVSATSCLDLTAYARWVTWSCAARTGLRAYDTQTRTFPLIATSTGANGFRVAGNAFVWMETVAGKTVIRLVAMPL